MPKGIDGFNSILVQAREVTSSGKATITLNEARSAVYAVVREQDASDTALARSQAEAVIAAGGTNKASAQALKAFAEGTLTTQELLMAWQAHAARVQGEGGVKVTLEEAKDVLRFIRSLNLNAAENDAALGFVRPKLSLKMYKAAQEAVAQDPPPPPPRPAVDLTRFKALLAAFRQEGSEYGQNLNLPEALALMYVLAKEITPVDAAAAATAAQEVLSQGLVGPKATPALQEFASQPQVTSARLFELWLAHASRREGVAGASIDEPQLKEGLAIVASPNLTQADKEALAKEIQKSRLTEAAQALLTTFVTPPEEPPPLPDVSLTFAEALGRFKDRMAAYRLPTSSYEENLNLPEANAALFELAYNLKPEDAPAAQAAVAAVIAEGKLGLKAAPALKRFVDKPLVDTATLFSYWLDAARCAQSESGDTIHTAEMAVGLSILADPNLVRSDYVTKLTQLTSLKLSEGARTLLNDCLKNEAIDPAVPVEPVTGDAALVLVDKVFAGFAALHPELTGEALLQAFYRHAYTRHSGKTDAEILARLQIETDINGSGSFTNREVASKVIADVVTQKAVQLSAWLTKSKVNSMIVLRYVGTEVIGRGLERGEPEITNKTAARVVLQKVAEGVYRVITAFPED